MAIIKVRVTGFSYSPSIKYGVVELVNGNNQGKLLSDRSVPIEVARMTAEEWARHFNCEVVEIVR